MYGYEIYPFLRLHDTHRHCYYYSHLLIGHKEFEQNTFYVSIRELGLSKRLIILV